MMSRERCLLDFSQAKYFVSVLIEPRKTFLVLLLVSKRPRDYNLTFKQANRSTF